ncbi:hypothetical protein [Enhygromyxa salina]|uniref:hypothetical protein n=1 Tax=Enhygromyxa salina TaxID=215803 RepID=UPI0004E759D5|nr:hypothetical protein [Enhygromyxa salina]
MNTIPTKSTWLALSAILLSGCGLLDGQDDAEFDGSDDDSNDTSNDTDTPPPPTGHQQRHRHPAAAHRGLSCLAPIHAAGRPRDRHDRGG